MSDYVEDGRAFLSHYGVLGMKWGVRKGRVSTGGLKNTGVTMRKDGSIDIAPGANLQRLVRANGKSLPMKDITYASTNEYDNARYIKIIGGKGFLGGGRDRILTIQATQPIKAPSVRDGTKIISDRMVKDSTFRAKNTNMLGAQISTKELGQIRKDPTGKTAEVWYRNTNQKMTFDKDFDPDAPYVQRAVREEMGKKGYNALRDENDAASGAGIAKAPIMIFNPKDSLRVVRVSDIDDKLRKANKAKLKEYKKNGNDWIDRELYDK